MDPRSYCEKDIRTNKFSLNSNGKYFGKAWSHDVLDVAAILPFTEHPLSINAVEEVEVPVKFRKWWSDDESLSAKLNYLRQSIVTKCGISSRKTTGDVMNEISYDCFYVTGNEVTPFSVPGDSGSLVLNEEGEVLGIVMEIQFHENNRIYITKVLPVWVFYDWTFDIKDFY